MPLEFRLQLASNGPVHIPQMVGHNRIDRLQDRGAFHRIKRFGIAPQGEQRPGKAVDDIAAVRLGRDRALDHAKGLVQLLATFHKAVAKVIQHQRLIRVQFQRLAEIGIGLFPALLAFVRDAAAVEDNPMGRVDRADTLQSLIIGL